MSELSNGWKLAKSIDICESVRDGTHATPSYVSDGFPLVTSRNIRPSGIDFSTAKYISDEDHAEISKRSKVDKGDILFSMIGSVGHVCMVDISTEFSIKNVGLFKTNPKKTEPRYLFHWLRSPQFWSWLDGNMRGGNQKFVTLGLLRELPIKVAPLPEQKRIADKLDAVLARVDACRDRLDRIPAILKRFRQSVLAAATSGKLTEEWRAELGYAYSDSWQTLTLADICARITDGEHISPLKMESGVPLLTAKNVAAHGVDFSNTHFVAPEDAQLFWKRCRPESGDVLICSRGTIGRCAEVPEAPPFCLMGTVILLKPNHEMILPKYLLFAISAPAIQKSMRKASGATAVSALYLRDIAQLEIIVPGIEEQTEIVRRVEALFTFADRLEARYTTARAQVEKLTPATLAKAFRGELVPQDPNDEPASVLLERIHTKHNSRSANKPKRGRQSPQTTKIA